MTDEVPNLGKMSIDCIVEQEQAVSSHDTDAQQNGPLPPISHLFQAELPPAGVKRKLSVENSYLTTPRTSPLGHHIYQEYLPSQPQSRLSKVAEQQPVSTLFQASSHLDTATQVGQIIQTFKNETGAEDSANSTRKRRRLYEEIERPYKCTWKACDKSYGTLSHLNHHICLQDHGPKKKLAEFKQLFLEQKLRRGSS